MCTNLCTPYFNLTPIGCFHAQALDPQSLGRCTAHAGHGWVPARITLMTTCAQTFASCTHAYAHHISCNPRHTFRITGSNSLSTNHHTINPFPTLTPLMHKPFTLSFFHVAHSASSIWLSATLVAAPIFTPASLMHRSCTPHSYVCTRVRRF